MDYLIRGGLVAGPSGEFVADVHVSQGIIKAVGWNLRDQIAGDAVVIPAEGKHVLPGGVDVHVHFGATSKGFVSADDYISGSIAAAAGGTTTVIDMVPQRYPESLRRGVDAWRGKASNASIDYSFHLMVTSVNEAVLEELPLLVDEGYSSFKVFLGTPDKHIDDGAFLRLLEAARGLNALVLVSAGNHHMEEYATSRLLEAGRSNVAYYPQSRPPIGEIEATSRAVRLAELVGTAVYVTHVSCGEALEQITAARARGVSVFAETCPHYLLLSSDFYQAPDLEARKFVVNPPLRDAVHQPWLWEALAAGYLQAVSSDHCPFNLIGEKSAGKTFEDIPTGLPGVETRLPLLYSLGVGSGRLSLRRFVELTAEMPAKIFGLYPRKGTIAVGADADLVIFDPEEQVRLSEATLHQNVDYCPYEGFQLKGYPVLTMLRGEIIVERGQYRGDLSFGQFVPRKPLHAALM